jgi:hypothetical protein
VCAAPASASAATLAPGQACFGDGDPITLGGTGFTPGAPVTVAADGRQFNGALTATATGTIAGRLVPFSLVAGKTQNSVFTATDTANPANVGQTTVTRARLRVTVSPANASPRSVRRFRATGFTAGSTLYRHIVRGRAVSNGKMAKLKGACRAASVRKRLFRKNAKSGTYRVQFDSKRSYSTKTVQRVRFRVRVYRIVRRANSASAASASTSEVWTQLP